MGLSIKKNLRMLNYKIREEEVEKLNTELMFSSESCQWETPKDFFDKLNDEFNFNLDPCTNNNNLNLPIYFTREDDGLLQDWGGL